MIKFARDLGACVAVLFLLTLAAWGVLGLCVLLHAIKYYLRRDGYL